MKTYIYFHISCINNWLTIVTDMVNDIKTSGLYNIIDEIRCFILGDFNVNFIPEIFNDIKIKICNVHPNIHLYEKFTLWGLYDDSLKEDFNVLYLHSKGVSHNSHPYIKDWVDYLIYFNIFKFKNILEYLTTLASIRINPSIHPSISGHSLRFRPSISGHSLRIHPSISGHSLRFQFAVCLQNFPVCTSA